MIYILLASLPRNFEGETVGTVKVLDLTVPTDSQLKNLIY